jgi:acyl-CoA synthetase (AMP-forming)/AMP-acid ligase II
MSKANNITFLLDYFEEYNHQVAIIWKDQSVTYKYILERIYHWINEFESIPENAIVGLEGDFSPETIAILYALIQNNYVVVPFDINHREKNVKKYEIAKIDYIIRVNDENNITIEKFSEAALKYDLYQTLFYNNDPGLVLFTSGSSGTPKAALHNFTLLLNKFKTKRKALKTINFLLFDHWGGLNTLFHIMSNGGVVVILQNRTPDYVCELIDKHKVELLPTSPTFLNMLLISRAYERFSIDSLKIISYGAEPMPEILLKNLNKLFPNIVLQQTYGLIELGVMRSKSEANGSLWVKIGGEGYQVRVIDNMLEIKSESAMLGYLNAPSPFTEDGWFMTGDAVEVNGDYFRILGRKSELINVGGEKVYPQEVENIILEIEGVNDVLVYGENNPLTGKVVCAKVFYVGDLLKKELISKIRSTCRIKLETFKVPVKLEIVDNPFRSDRFKKQRIN